MWKIIFGLSILIISPLCSAAKIHSLTEVEQVAYEFASQQAQHHYDHSSVIVKPLDGRLRLHACSSKLTAFSNSAETTLGNRTVGIRCAKPVEWSVYVSVKVQVMENVVVSRKPLPANHLISKSDIKTVVMDISKLRHGYISSQQVVIGKQLRYPVSSGKALSPRLIKSKKLVERGSQVVLVARGAGMEVKMNGTAMEDAKLGDIVKAMNNSSERIVEGVVEAPGIILVRM